MKSTTQILPHYCVAFVRTLDCSAYETNVHYGRPAAPYHYLLREIPFSSFRNFTLANANTVYNNAEM